jgi:putative PIN family toxin of toxin-antitoxin system
VFDTNVYVAGLLNPKGGSGESLSLWREDAMFEVIASRNLFGELHKTLLKPRLQGRFQPGEPERAISGLAHAAEFWPDLEHPKSVTRDVDDDYSVSLAVSSQADALVTLDEDLLVLRRLETPDKTGIPVIKPGELLAWLREAGVR